MRNKYVSGEAEEANPQSPTDGSLSTTLSKILSNTHSRGEVVTVSFKALPIDMQVNSTVVGEASAAPPSNAKEAIIRLVETLTRACDDFGVVSQGFIREGDVVRYVNAFNRRLIAANDRRSAAEAQKSTTLFSKFEYNLKRLLWLGS
jgi:phosphatidylinositol 4-phosphatase